MRHPPLKNTLFKKNRNRLTSRLAPNSVAIVNANDLLPTNADGTLVMHPNSDLFYLSGIEQEESILVLAPDAFDERRREILFLRETNDHLRVWEGDKLTKDEARKRSGIDEIKWLDEFPAYWRMLMCECDQVYLNSNEHSRAEVMVQSRDARFIEECQRKYPLHRYERLTRILTELRQEKSEMEVDLLRTACGVTRDGFLRVLKFVKPGVNEREVEAEYAHEFIRGRAKFAYSPIIASGQSSCILHYLANDQLCRKGDLLLMDVGACYANYNADMTRTIPVSGKFTKRQRKVYDAVLRVLRSMIASAVAGKLHRDWQREAEAMMNSELLELELLTKGDIRNERPERRACRKYFMHGLGHSLGLDVHDVTVAGSRFLPGWVITVEPGIYIPEEGFGIRLENNILVTESGPADLMEDIPIEAEEIEALMK